MANSKSSSEDLVDKRKVTMTNKSFLPDGGVAEMQVVDYVRPDFLDAYVADARTRWQFVEVSDEPDAGPGGYEGDTFIPEHLKGKSAVDFGRYGDPTTPDNALDEYNQQNGV